MTALDDLLGESAAMVDLRFRVQRVLQRLSTLPRLPPILIQGETGTGKTFLARLIHRASPRSAGPFVDINCAAIPEPLLESELFGYERFAFTDAKRAKDGLFQTASGGVLFLDEIGLMPLGLQAKLLKAIDEGVVRRLGSSRNESVNVGIITASNDDLRLAVEEKRFRADLYSRIAVLSLELPPLRAREGDIELLAERLLSRACEEYGVPPKALGADARKALRSHPWPGNVRELRNVMERVALELDASIVTADGLGLSAHVRDAEGQTKEDAEAHLKDRLIEALTRTNWNITQTATRLQVSRKTVRARIQRFGLRPPTGIAASSASGAASQHVLAREAGETELDLAQSSGTRPAVTAAGMHEIRIYTLGRFAVFVAGQAVLEDTWQNAPARQLLKWLVTRAGHRTSAGPALEFAGPMLEVNGGVEAACSALDRALGAGSDAVSSILVDGGGTAALRPDAPIWVDADSFERCIAEAERATDPMALLLDADALYVGDYLPTDIDDAWPVDRREHLRHTWVQLQLRLAREYERRGKLDEAIAALRRALATDDTDEQVAQTLVRLLSRHGQVADARLVSQTLVNALRNAGIDPSPGSVELARELDTSHLGELPTGVVTVLMTDIEGSIRIWERDAELMRQALIRHDQLFATGVMECNGAVLTNREDGDGLSAVFGRPIDAVLAACRIQRALQAEPSMMALPILVRMALDTSEVDRQSGSYSGPALLRCARLRGAAHGGQILLTQATYDLVHDSLSSGIVLMEAGHCRLRDASEPTRVFQVCPEGLATDFPPLRVSGHDSTALVQSSAAAFIPAVSSALIGREQEVAVVRDLLLRAGVRLVTLTGPPGTGKTRLALELATDLGAHFADGAYFVALAPIGDPDRVPWAIGHALGLQERGSRSVIDTLKDHLKAKDVLIVLDNFEHVVSAAPLVAELLEASPRVKMLATSRAPLHLRAEHEFPVPPLALPNAKQLTRLDALAQCASVALYLDRARAVRPDFSLTEANAGAVVEICRRLDGLPLAIELAAARSKLLPPQAMLRRLERRMPLLIGGARDLPARQQTLRGAIAWSHDLLDETDQRLFRRLSVFVGGWTIQAAQVCCNPRADLSVEVLDGVASLLDKSLIRQDLGSESEPRFGMLETIREYALDELQASGEVTEMRDRHLDYFLGLAEEADIGLLGPQQVGWCDRLEVEHDNIGAAFGWVLTALSGAVASSSGLTRAATRLDAAIRLADALELFWTLRGHSRENFRHVTELISHTQANTEERARILVIAGYMAQSLQDPQTAINFVDEGLTIWRTFTDARQIAVALTRRGVIGIRHGDYAGATALLTEARALFKEHGGEQNSGIEHPIAAFLAQAMHEQGDLASARVLYEESLAEARDRGDRHAVAYALRHLARLHFEAGDADRAVEFLREGLPYLAELRDRRCTPPCLEILAFAIGRREQWNRAARLFAAADALREATGMPLMRSDRTRQEGELADLLGRLGRVVFDSEWTTGREMTLHQAIDDALDASLPPRAGVEVTINRRPSP